jgi:hypothetical protein
MSSATLPDRIRAALVDPRMALEVRVWLNPKPAQRHPEGHPLRDPLQLAAITAERHQVIFGYRGATYGETAMHWAALGEKGLMIDLVSLGLDPNAVDTTGRTPMDWLSDRAWMVLATGQGRTDQIGKEKLRIASEDLLACLWGVGGRPSGQPLLVDANHLLSTPPGAVQVTPTPPRQHCGYLWAGSGLWGALSLLKSSIGADGWRNWTEEGAGLLHAWILGPESEEKTQALLDALRVGLSVDEDDNMSRGPLWYAVDAWIADPSQWGTRMRDAVDELIANGADPEKPDVDGVAPLDLAEIRGAPEWLAMQIGGALRTPLSAPKP